MDRRRPTIISYAHDPMRCRICQSTIEVASNAMPGGSGQPPSDGDGSLCMVCGEISIFQVTNGRVVGLREPNFVELAKFVRVHRRLIAAVAEIRAKRGNPNG